MIKSDRYLLFIDLLGFTNLVKTRDVLEVYQIINDAMMSFKEWERINDSFGVLYFSDSFIFYQKEAGYHDAYFLDIYAIGGLILSALLSKEIPARGVISYGEFFVDNASSDQKIYFGNALLEAFEHEKESNWIGIKILESAWKPYEFNHSGNIEVFEAEHVWLRNGPCLLLNPFIKIRTWHLSDDVSIPYSNWDAPYFINDIKGFSFLHKKAHELSLSADFTSREASKYFSTIQFLKRVMDKDLYDWALHLSRNSGYTKHL